DTFSLVVCSGGCTARTRTGIRRTLRPANTCVTLANSEKPVQVDPTGRLARHFIPGTPARPNSSPTPSWPTGAGHDALPHRPRPAAPNTADAPHRRPVPGEISCAPTTSPVAHADPELVAQAARLAALEQQCCRFFTFTIELSADTVVLTVQAPATARDPLDAL